MNASVLQHLLSVNWLSPLAPPAPEAGPAHREDRGAEALERVQAETAGGGAYCFATWPSAVKLTRSPTMKPRLS